MKDRLLALAGGLGILGSLACSAAMVMAVAGLVGTGLAAAGATSSGDMLGMGGPTATLSTVPHVSGSASPLGAAVTFLIEAGPVILVFSIAAIAVAVGVRRRSALLPAALGGLALYWGMYMQADRTVMYASIGLGLAAFVAAYVWSSQGARPLRSR